MRKPVGDRFYMGTGGGRKVAWASCPMALRFFLVNHGRDARATFGTAVFASGAPAVKRITETGRRPVLHGTGCGNRSATGSTPEPIEDG